MSSTNRPEAPRPSIRQRIQRRLVPLILLAGAVIAGLASIVVYTEMDEAIMNNLFNLNQATARVYGTQVDLSGLTLNGDMQHLAQKEFLLVVLGADGRVVHSSHPGLALPQIALDGPDGPVHWNGWSLFRTRTGDGQVIVSGMLDEERNELILQMVSSVVVPVVAVLAALLVAALWFVKLGLRPLQDLSGALRARDPRALTPVEETGQPAELTPIVQALNGLFARVRDFLQRERKFIDDAAHELRTPLTIIKAQAQAIDPSELSEENRARLGHVIAGVNRASALGAGLLQQARAEQAPGQTQAVDAVALARQVLDDLALTHGDGLARADLTISAAQPVLAAPEDLRIILRNLLDNAARHGRHEGAAARIRITIGTRQGKGLITIEDAGPGIPDAQHDQIFERFWRKGRADGSGLGLSITRALVQRGDMALTVSRSPDLGGARFDLTLPLAKS